MVAKNCLEQPGGYLSQAEFNMLQRSELFMADYKPSGVPPIPPTGNLSDDLMVVNRPLGDVYVIRLVNAEPSLMPVCTGNVIVNARCTPCRSDANLVPAIKTDPGSQTAKAVRGGSELATNAAVIAEAAKAYMYPIAESARHTVATAAMEATRAKAELETNAIKLNTGFHFGVREAIRHSNYMYSWRQGFSC